jgi:hypothetical protein
VKRTTDKKSRIGVSHARLPRCAITDFLEEPALKRNQAGRSGSHRSARCR